MARRRMVTRTIESATAHIMTVNILDGGAVGNVDFTVTGDIDNIDILKVAKKELESDFLKLVYITSIDKSTELYGMDETEFIRLAKKLPPRTGTNEE